jgi:hypothetical protein
MDDLALMPRRRTQPPRLPPGPPACAKEGAAAVLKAAVKLFDRQDGAGVDACKTQNFRLCAGSPGSAGSLLDCLDHFVVRHVAKALMCGL